MRTLLDEPVPGEGAPADLARAWHKKALIAEELQQIEKRTEYLGNALPYARQANLEELALGGLQRIRFEYATSLWYSKSVAASQESTLELALELERSQRLPPLLLTLYFHVITNYVHMGDLDNARLALGKADALYRQLSRRPQLAMRLPHFSSLLENRPRLRALA